jgi:predicted nucleic acid-binding protein
MENDGGRTRKGRRGEVTDVPPSLPEFVSAEQNLETIGYFAAGYKRRYPTAEQKSKLVVLGHDRSIEIVPTAKYGYPNSDDLDFYRAFLKICQKQAIFTEHLANGRLTFHPRLPSPIGFHTRELIRTAGRTESARERRAVRAWIERGTFTGIRGDLFSAKTGQIDSAFGGPLFSQFVFTGDELRDGQLADRHYVWLAPWFMSNYFHHYFHLVDLAFHRRLHKPIAKALYPILDTGWYATRGKPYSKRYSDLCALLSIPAHKKLSLAKQQLDPSHAELLGTKFLAAWEYKFDRHGKWTGVIRWSPGEKWFQDREERKPRSEQARPVHRPSPFTQPVPSVTEVAAAPLAFSTDEPVRDRPAQQAGAHYAELVADFYRRLGQPRISKAKLDKGCELLESLTDADGRRFTPEEISAALTWIVSHREDRFNGKVYSLRLLPEVIGEALQESDRTRKTEQERQRQLEEAERLAAEHERRQRLEARYRSLPLVEQKSLRESATNNLLQRGVSKRLLLETLVMGEVCRLLEEEEKLRGAG